MTVKITYFVHGTTVDNENEMSSGWNDVELSELGIKQATQLRAQTKDHKFDVVFCSDLKRAVNSAKLTFGDTVEIITDERLRECNYGTLNAAPSAIVVPMCKGECIKNKFPEGESYEDVKERMQSFLNFLKENYDGKHIAVVAHMAPQISLDVLLKGKTWEQAFAEDWRNTKSWQPGWEYIIK